MNCHLIAVKISIKGGAYQWMELNGFAFNKDGFKGLYSQPVQGRGPVQQYAVFFDHIIKGVKDLRLFSFDHFFCALDCGNKSLFIQLVIDERLEELQGHFFREPALMQTKIRAHNNDRSSGIVHTFSKEILSESSLFAFEYVT